MTWFPQGEVTLAGTPLWPRSLGRGAGVGRRERREAPWGAGTSAVAGPGGRRLAGTAQPPRVALSRGQRPAGIGIDDPDRQWPWPFPRGGDRPASAASCQCWPVSRRPGRTAGPGPVAAGERVAQGGGLQRGRRHALGVGRVRAADRVADDEQPGREAAQPLVVAANVGRELVGGDVVEWLGVADRGEDVGCGAGLDEAGESFGVGWRVVSAVPERRQDLLAAGSALCGSNRRDVCAYSPGAIPCASASASASILARRV